MTWTEVRTKLIEELRRNTSECRDLGILAHELGETLGREERSHGSLDFFLEAAPFLGYGVISIAQAVSTVLQWYQEQRWYVLPAVALLASAPVFGVYFAGRDLKKIENL